MEATVLVSRTDKKDAILVTGVKAAEISEMIDPKEVAITTIEKYVDPQNWKSVKEVADACQTVSSQACKLFWAGHLSEEEFVEIENVIKRAIDQL